MIFSKINIEELTLSNEKVSVSPIKENTLITENKPRFKMTLKSSVEIDENKKYKGPKNRYERNRIFSESLSFMHRNEIERDARKSR